MDSSKKEMLDQMPLLEVQVLLSMDSAPDRVMDGGARGLTGEKIPWEMIAPVYSFGKL